MTATNLFPGAKAPFKRITPGGSVATVLLFASDCTLSYHVAHMGSYRQVYGRLGAVIG